MLVQRAPQGDDVLLRLCCLTLRGLQLSLLLGLLLSVLLRKMSADHAATDRTNDGVVPSVMPSDPANHCTLEAACGVCRAYHCEGQRRCNQGDSYRASFHSKVLGGCVFRMWRCLALFQ
ncbi:hypothetical protein QF001_005385 [Paraburkholderia youngii]